MIVGGTFRGLGRAIRQSLSFILAYALFGTPLVFLVGIPLAGGNLGPKGFAIGHIYVIIVMLPAAVVGNFLALRVLQWRSWRHERWRARASGILAVILVWAGLLTMWGDKFIPEPLLATLGELAVPMFFLAVVVACSNLALLAAWLLPPFKKARSGS